jgi:hypothetical protein
MTNTNLIIIGTRSRPHLAVRAFDALKEVSEISDFVMIINEDQVDLYPQIDGVTTEVVANDLGCNGKGNAVVHKYWDKYKTISGIDDDTIVRTQGWDKILYQPIKDIGYGVSYGNDGIQGEMLPTKVTISTNIIKALGFWAPPVLFHSFADDFWKKMGQTIGSLHYFEDVSLEHLHWSNNKSQQDETYKSNTPELVASDSRAYSEYISTQFDLDMVRLRESLGL